MAGLVLGTAGAFIGNMIAPGIGGQIGYALGSMVGGSLFQETQKFEGARLNDLSVQSNTNGLPITRGWGTFRTSGNVIWTSGYNEIKTTTEQGGKGGPTAEVTNYTYTINVAIAVHYGEIAAIRRVWANKKLVADFSETNSGSIGNLSKYMRVYKGSEFQEVDSLIEQYEGVYTPAFKGLSYVVFENLPLEEYGNQLPQFEFEVVVGNLFSSDLNTVTIPNFTGTTNTIYALYENTADKHLYAFTDNGVTVYVQKINQDTMTVVQESSFPVSNFLYKLGGGGGNDYKHMLANDSVGNIYSYNLSSSIVNIKKLNKDTLIPENYIYTDYQTALQPLQKNKCDVNSIYTKSDGTTMTFFNKELITSNYTKFVVKEFSATYGISSASSPRYELVNSGMTGNYIISTYNKNNNQHYFVSYIGYTGGVLNPAKPTLNIASMGGFSEDILRLSDGLTNKTVYDMQIDNIRNKLYVFLTHSGTNLIEQITILQINLNTLQIENSVTMPNNNGWYYRINGVLNLSNNSLIIPKTNSSLELIKFYTINCNDFTYTEKQYTKAELNNAYPYHSVYSSKIFGLVSTGSESNTTNNTLIILGGSRYAKASYKLNNLVKDICLMSGLQDTEINTDELQLIDVLGFKSVNQTTARQLLETLSIYYNFDSVESGDKIKFTLRGKDPVKTIQYEEIGAKFYSRSYDDSNIFKTQRIQESELPKILNIIYYDLNKDYEQNTQEAKRVIETTDNINTIQAPLVFTATEAKRIVDRIMYQSYISRDKYQFDLNYNHIDLEPSDVIKLVKNGQEYYLRITNIDDSQGILKLECESEQKTVYTQNSSGSSGLVANDSVVSYANTSMYLLDIPIFDKSDNNGGNYAVVDKDTGTWRGAVIYKSNEINGNFSAQETFQTNTITGKITSLYDSNNRLNTVDYLSNFTILTTSNLSSITYDELLNGGNIALIGNELIQFMNVELVAQNTYKISGLLRGRFGTEQYINTHATNDTFILFNFNNSSIKRINKNDLIYGVTKYYKGVTVRTSIEDTTTQPFTNNGIGLKPYSVVNAIGTRNSNGDLYVEFKPRARGVALLINNGEAEDIDGSLYEIDILNGSNVVRTIYTTSTNFVYTASQQATDFGSTQNNISLKIYKVNQSYGRGFEYVNTF